MQNELFNCRLPLKLKYLKGVYYRIHIGTGYIKFNWSYTSSSTHHLISSCNRDFPSSRIVNNLPVVSPNHLLQSHSQPQWHAQRFPSVTLSQFTITTHSVRTCSALITTNYFVSQILNITMIRLLQQFKGKLIVASILYISKKL